MKILVHVVDLITDEPAILFAGMIARHTGAPITLFHVASKKMEKEISREQGRALLAAASKLIPDVDLEMKVRRGNPTKKVAAEVREGGYDLFLVPTWQVNRILHSLPLGVSVADALPCCVLVVRNPKTTLERILICTGGMHVSRAVIETGANLAVAFGAHVSLLHVAGFIPSMYTGLESIEETLDELLHTHTPVAQHLRQSAEYLAGRGLQAELKLRHGPASYEILRELDMAEYDLVVLGASGASSGWREWLMGNVTQEVMMLAGLPVLVVNQSRAEKDSLNLFGD